MFTSEVLAYSTASAVDNESSATSIDPPPFLLMAQSNTFFPPIGSVVSQAGQPASSEAIEGEDDEKLLQEIESLCMKCHEQVQPLSS